MFAFEQMKNDSEDATKVYESMTAVLRCVLEEMRLSDGDDDPNVSLPV